jgi:UPF0176 protein
MQKNHKLIIFYKYTPVTDVERFVVWQKKNCAELGLFGRILIAKEGINGTVEGLIDHIEEYERRMHTLDQFGDFSNVWFKESPTNGGSFEKMKVKARTEIVATGLSLDADIDPNQITGTHIEPEELKRWIEKGEEFEIIDMRNDYEYAVGHFAGSRDSGMKNFRDLSKIVSEHEDIKEKKILTVCTYGVRCEKASGHLIQQGFKEVYQLHGGIGTYMKKYPGEDFQGSLYVFDNRMTEQFTDQYQKIGVCVVCSATSERFGNCAWPDCHKQLIICEVCAPQKSSIYCQKDCEQSHRVCIS